MSQLTKPDLNWAIQRLPPKVAKILKDRTGRLFVAGGYLRSRITGEKVNDIDLFAPSREDALQAIEDLVYGQEIEAFGRTACRMNNGKWIYETDNAYTLKGSHPMVQAIHRWTFDDPIAAIESFDFTIAKAAIWWTGTCWESVCHPDFYADLAGKRLVYTSPIREEAAGGSLLRVLKFYQRGYRIPLESLSAVLARLVNSVDMTKVDPDKVINKRGPMATKEEALAFVLSGLLREVDPNIDPEENQPLAGAAEQKETNTHE